MEHHPIANVWPMMEEDKLAELAQDIKENGQLVPVWIFEGKILDGRNRFAACKIAGVEPKTEVYTGDQPAAFAVSLNDRRRHMTKSALAAVGAELLPFFEEEAKERQREGGKNFGRGSPKVREKIPEPIDRPRIEAAKSVGVNERYIQDAKEIKESAPEIFQKLKAGRISIQDAKREVAKKPVDDWRKDERDRQKLVESGKTVVANSQNDKNLICWAESRGIAVRIDRGTRYGNPFILDEDGDRSLVCDCFSSVYLPHKPSILKRIGAGELSGKVLVCYCFPERCHGDTLADLANNPGRSAQ